jgi:hypothetical protein
MMVLCAIINWTIIKKFDLIKFDLEQVKDVRDEEDFRGDVFSPDPRGQKVEKVEKPGDPHDQKQFDHNDHLILILMRYKKNKIFFQPHF